MIIVEIEPIFRNENDRANFKNSIAPHQFISYDSRPEETSTVIERAKVADAILVSNIPITKEILDLCGNLKMISVAFSGVDHIDLAECHKRNIEVKNAAGYSSQSVAELTLGLIINLLRKIGELDRNTRALLDRNGFLGSQLSGKTVGIVGAGLIGTRLGEMLYSIGCEVFFTSTKEKSDTLWGKYLPFSELLAKSDIVSLHVPLTERTTHLIDEIAISKMKNGVFLVNTARGKVVDSVALSNALHSGKIAGAAIDVFDVEPPLPANHPLLEAPNCLLTPHIAYATKEAFENRATMGAKNILNWLESIDELECGSFV